MGKITIHITYTGDGQNAKRFMEEMIRTGVVEKIQKEPGNIGYDYYIPVSDPHSVLLIDSWENQEALDRHHASPMMDAIWELREKYDLHMRVERFAELPGDTDKKFIR
ncbi:MAG: antibiotic biosynthesis monooxygenase [Clostridia bacterium]|nr:antibiotic biosynthesis monooxygenase [Clostridia bacterium]